MTIDPGEGVPQVMSYLSSGEAEPSRLWSSWPEDFRLPQFYSQGILSILLVSLCFNFRNVLEEETPPNSFLLFHGEWKWVPLGVSSVGWLQSDDGWQRRRNHSNEERLGVSKGSGTERRSISSTENHSKRRLLAGRSQRNGSRKQWAHEEYRPS